MIANKKRSIRAWLSGFTMIELVIALVVIIVAVLSIMVLFPIGMDANRSAISKSSAFNATEQFLHYMATRVKAEWHISDALPTDDKPFADTDPAMRVWSEKSLTNNKYLRIHWYVNEGSASADFDPQVHNTGLFRVDQLSAEDVTDFSVVVRAWKDVDDYGDGSDLSAKRVSLKAEVSWPAELPYASRSTEVFETVLFHPGEVSRLVVELASDRIFEHQAGDEFATTGIVRRVFGGLSDPLVVNLTSSDTTEATVNVSSLTIPAGEATASFGVFAVDDDELDGNQSVVIRAADSAGLFKAGRDNLVVVDDEKLQLLITIADDEISEFGGSTTGTVTRIGGQQNGALPVTLISSDQLEATFDDHVVVIRSGEASATFTIRGVDDNLLDGDKTVHISGSAPGYVAVQDSLVVTDYETITLSITPDTISEGDGSGAATATVRRSNTNTNQPLTVSLGASKSQVIDIPGTISIPAHSQVATFEIDAIDNNTYSGDESITVVITASATGYQSGQARLTVMDEEGLTLQFADTSISENGGTTTGTVTRNIANPTGDLVVTLTSGDTSEATVPSTVTIPDGAVSATFTISAQEDARLDGTQTVVISASADQFSDASAELNVTDYEVITVSISPDRIWENAANPAAYATITRSNTDPTDPAFNAPLEVTLNSNDTDNLQVDPVATIPAGQASVQVPLTAVNDGLLDGDVTVIVSAIADGYVAAPDEVVVMDSDLVVTLADNPIAETAADGPVSTIGTVRRGQVGTAITLQLASSDVTEATIAEDKVTFAADSLTATFTIHAVNDGVPDGDQDVVISASGSGMNTGQTTLTVLDSGAALLVVTIAPDTFAEDGGDGVATGTVTINTGPADEDIIITLASDDTSEATVPTTVTIPAGQTSVTFPVNAVDDGFADGDQVVTISASTDGYQDGSTTVTVRDTDAPGLTIAISPAAFEEDAGSHAATGTVTINTGAQEEPVIVALHSSDLGEATVPSTVTIPAGETSITFAVAAINDGIIDGDQSVTVTASTAGYLDAEVDITVLDVGLPKLLVSIELERIMRGAGDDAGTVTISRTSDPAGELLVALESSDAAHAVLPGTVTFPAGSSTVTVSLDAPMPGADGPQGAGLESTDASSERAVASQDGGGEHKVAAATELNVTITASEVNHQSGQAEVTIWWGPGGSDCEVVAGLININPNNSPNNEFIAVVDGGATITRDDLHRDAPVGGDGVYYAGPVTSIRVKPKGNGNQNSLILDGETQVLQNRTTYIITAEEPFGVVIFNDHMKNGKAMGHWWIQFDGEDCVELAVGDSDDIAADPEETKTLSLTVNPASVIETAGSMAAVGTVTRDSDTTGGLLVTLSSSDTTTATVPATVSIAAGSSTATFHVGAVVKEGVSGTRTAQLTAAADEHEPGSAVFTVRDSFFGDGLFIEEKIVLTGSSRIVGTAITNSTAANSVDLGWSAIITDDLVIGPGGVPAVVLKTPRPNEEDNVGGDVHNLEEPLVFTLPPFPVFPNGEDKGRIKLSGGANRDLTIGPADYDGNRFDEIEIIHNRTLTIDLQGQDRTIRVGTLDIQQGHIVLLNGGSLTFFVENGITLGGDSTINGGGDTEAAHIYYAGGGAISPGGNTRYVGSLYAETADISIPGSSGIMGHIITGGSNVSITGDASALVRVLMAPLAKVTVTGSGKLRGGLICRELEGTGNIRVIHDIGYSDPIPDLPGE